MKISKILTFWVLRGINQGMLSMFTFWFQLNATLTYIRLHPGIVCHSRLCGLMRINRWVGGDRQKCVFIQYLLSFPFCPPWMEPKTSASLPLTLLLLCMVPLNKTQSVSHVKKYWVGRSEIREWIFLYRFRGRVHKVVAEAGPVGMSLVAPFITKREWQPSPSISPTDMLIQKPPWKCKMLRAGQRAKLWT